MKRQLNLRQVEAFKAVIEQGTVGRAADVLFVTQPAVSKLIAHLEEESGLTLFERIRGKLAPTREGMLLYSEIDRIFSGLRQVEQAVDSIRREQEKTLSVGVLPALSGSFIRRVTMEFLNDFPGVKVSIQSRSSLFLADWLVRKQIDVALVGSAVDNPNVNPEPFVEHPLVCAMPKNHPLANREEIYFNEISDQPLIAFSESSQTRALIDRMFEKNGVLPNVVLETVAAPTVCEFIAAGLGIALIHPLFADGMQDQITLRPFKPEMRFQFQLCRAPSPRSPQLVNEFVERVRKVSAQMTEEILHSQRE